MAVIRRFERRRERGVRRVAGLTAAEWTKALLLAAVILAGGWLCLVATFVLF